MCPFRKFLDHPRLGICVHIDHGISTSCGHMYIRGGYGDFQCFLVFFLRLRIQTLCGLTGCGLRRRVEALCGMVILLGLRGLRSNSRSVFLQQGIVYVYRGRVLRPLHERSGSRSIPSLFLEHLGDGIFESIRHIRLQRRYLRTAFLHTTTYLTKRYISVQ